jgi:transposase
MSSVPTEIRVGIDIGSAQHSVAIGLSNGSLLEEFNLSHTPEGFRTFFERIKVNQEKFQLPVAVAMEGYNGHARPVDDSILAQGYRLLNVNNHKLARFKEIFPGAAKTDSIDARKILELFTLKEHLPLARDVLQVIVQPPVEHEKLKYLTRRRRVLVGEKTRVLNRMQSDLNAIAPGLLNITKDAANKWFLHFLTARNDFSQLVKLRISSLLKIPGVGKTYVQQIQTWQKEAKLSPEVEWVGKMIIQDARRILMLQQEIKELVEEIENLSNQSFLAQRLSSIPGFGKVTIAELAGEIGAIERFSNQASLALYLGMAPVDQSSGKRIQARAPKHVNVHAKMALMAALAKHIQIMPQAKCYYQKKRTEGKKHNQAVRAFGRHMVRVIWNMLRNNRDYQVCKN